MSSGLSANRAATSSGTELPPSTVYNRHSCIVVDDDDDVRHLVSRVLSRIGVESTGISTPNALRRALTERQPDIVVLDIGLGRWDAVDGIRLLEEHSFKGAVLLISGKPPTLLNDVRAVGERHGLQMLVPLRKPFLSDQLIRAVQNHGSGMLAGGGRDDVRPTSVHAATVPLAEALRCHWMDLFYQPKIDLARGVVVGVEGLARMRHPARGVLSPAAFLQDASNTDLADLTEFVVLKALRDWEILDQQGFNFRIAVNAPVSALTGTRLTELIRENRPKSASWPGLVIEITESDAIQDIVLTAEIAVQLRIYNVDLAIDDFGTGYSSFDRLKQFRFREIKLDRSYVHGCAADPINASICQGIVNLAHAFGALAVAEGVERGDDRDLLRVMGCDLAQGYLFSRPTSLEGLVEVSAALSR